MRQIIKKKSKMDFTRISKHVSSRFRYIDRVKAADGVAQHDKPVREARHAFVVPPAVGSVFIGDNGSYWLGLFDRFIQARLWQAASVGDKACFVIRWVIA